jgi:dienelactone hydrolase
LLFLAGAAQAADVQRGTVRFEPLGDQANIPKQYRLQAHTFDYELSYKTTLKAAGVEIFRLTFPSPVESPHKENNTVYAEYYRPKGKGPFPGVVILDITGGDQSLSRSLATDLAQKGIAGLFVQMAYYGPRRPKGSKLRLMSYNLPQTFAAIRQTVLDVRRATAWLESRPEVDAKRLGLMGTSLGSMVGALCAEMEPKLRRVVVLLGGGGLIDGYWDHPQARKYTRPLESMFGKQAKERAKELFAPIDPLTCAENLKDRKLLILAAKRDEVVPPSMTEALWKATGKQKIVWYDCGHYSAILYLLPALTRIADHFKSP